MKNILQQFMLKTLTILCVFATINTYSQYGVVSNKNYGGTGYDIASSVITTMDGGQIIIGSSNSHSDDFTNTFGSYLTGAYDVWVVKTNALGFVEWKQNYGSINSEVGISIEQTSDGGYILGCQKNSQPTTNYPSNQDYWLIRIDSVGNKLWENDFGGSDIDLLTDVIELSDGGFIAAGYTSSSDNDVSNNNSIYEEFDFWIVKTDVNGNFLWEKNYGGGWNEQLSSIIEDNGDLVMFGTTRSFDYGNRDLWVLKTDSIGNELWNKNYGGSLNEHISYATRPDIIKTLDGGYAFLGRTISTDYDVSTHIGSMDIWLVKIDFSGNLEWESVYGSTNEDYVGGIVQKSNGNIIIGGSTKTVNHDVIANYGDIDAWIVEVDTLGNILSTSNIGGSGIDRLEDVAIDDNDNLIILCSTGSSDYDLNSNYGGLDFWIATLKPLFANVYGSVVFDENENCVKDTNENLIPNVILQANNLSSTTNNYYANSNSNGNFSFSLDSVSHNISLALPASSYFNISSCSTDTVLANLSSSNLNDTINFFLNPTVLCPKMEVDISAPLLRRCMVSTYNISYCNNGTQIANNAYVEIEFDPSITINYSSIPWVGIITGNTYTFPIGNIDMFECGSFSVNVSVTCDSTTFSGQVLCAEAHIYPDTICLPSSNTWNGAELQARAECIGTDSIEFALRNVGAGNMLGDLPAIVIEDVFLIMDSLVRLNAGEEMKWKFPSNGTSTHRMVAQQPSDHPFKTFTTDAVAYCNLAASVGPPSVQDSVFLAYPNDEEAVFIAIDCQPIISSYDPNDKTVYPVGAGANHYISETTDLKYKIRFQNTGTDTAFTVAITDSISSFLDLATINPGVSSHPYQFDVYGTGVVKFTFNNILLPDSFVDEPASHGFVQYKIKQKTGNQVGDKILNNADIFFDFNLPIRTNTAFSEIGGIFLDTIIYIFPKTEDPETPDGVKEVNLYNIKTYPNPARNFIVFELEEKLNNISIELYSTDGKLQQKTIGVNANKVRINKGHLANGLYLFKIYSDAKEIAYGRLMFK